MRARINGLRALCKIWPIVALVGGLLVIGLAIRSYWVSYHVNYKETISGDGEVRDYHLELVYCELVISAQFPQDSVATNANTWGQNPGPFGWVLTHEGLSYWCNPVYTLDRYVFHWCLLRSNNTAAVHLIAGCGWWYSDNGYTRRLEVDFNIWVIMLIIIAALMYFWQRRVNRGRSKLNTKLDQCRKCNYDLRASKDRCPECGTPIPPPKDLKPPESDPPPEPLPPA